MRVPEYQPNVSLRPISQQNVNVRATPDAFGADIGRGMQQLGQGVGQFGQAMAQVQALEDDARFKEADNAFSAWLRERMYGEGGFMTLEGRNAVDARQAFEFEVEQKRREFGAGLTPGAAQAYQNASNARMQQVLQSAIVHTANERKNWVNQASAARVATFGDDALANYNNSNLVERNLMAGILEIRQQAELNGWDADKLAYEESQFISGVRNNIALRLAQDDPLAAEEYVRAHEDDFSGEHRTRLNDVLSGPVLQRRAEQAAAEIITGSPRPDPASVGLDTRAEQQGAASDVAQRTERALGLAPSGTPPQPNRNGTYSPNAIAQSMVGMTEGANATTLANFIRDFAGLEIDPRTTAWCAAFVNAVLGASGIEGTGALNARSFLSFGTATNDPRPGDIVVLSRGDPNGWQGHVGFFQGYDANGNILVLGGNQSDSVSVAAYSSDRLLGFRRATSVPPGGNIPITHTPQGLAHIEQQLAAIDDPRLREATRQQITRTIEAQNAAARAARQQTLTAVEQYMIANPGVTPSDLPIEAQQAIGVDGMGTLWRWHDQVVQRGQPVTDERILFDMQTLYNADPGAFLNIDLWQFRDRLSNEDWERVNGWRASALSNSREAREEQISISSAMSLAQNQLEAAGLTTTGLTGNRREQVSVELARFQLELSRRMETFRAREGRVPSQTEIQQIVSELLLPVVMRQSQPATEGGGWIPNPVARVGSWFGGGEVEGRLYEFGELGDQLSADGNITLNIQYGEIPLDARLTIEATLRQRSNGRDPTQDEVVAIYKQYLLNRR